MAAHILSTSQEVMLYAAEGRLSKHALATLLNLQARSVFLDACAEIEKKYTEACASRDPCLEAGCSAEGERCVQPLLRAGTEYHKACGTEWVKLFANDGNRSSTWRLAVADIDPAA